MPVVLLASLAPGSGRWPGIGVGFPARGKFRSFKTCFVLGGDLNKNWLVTFTDCSWRWGVSRSPLSASIPDKTFSLFLINLFLFSSWQFSVPHWQKAAAARLGAVVS